LTAVNRKIPPRSSDPSGGKKDWSGGPWTPPPWCVSSPSFGSLVSEQAKPIHTGRSAAGGGNGGAVRRTAVVGGGGAEGLGRRRAAPSPPPRRRRYLTSPAPSLPGTLPSPPHKLPSP
jgi:hypothetical protein